MHSLPSYILAAASGVMLAYFISRPPDLRSMRLSQFVFLPPIMVLLVYCLPEPGGSPNLGDIGQLMGFLAVLGFLVMLVSPNIAYFCGAGLSNFLDPQNWTCAEEELALRPIRKLIEKDHYHQALSELDEILKNHRPTYEALLLKAKLLHQCGRMDETEAALLCLIPLCQTTPQQLTVMEALALLDEYHRSPPEPPAPGVRRVQIYHELVLFQMSGETPPAHQVVPPGVYEVEEDLHRNGHWLKLAGQDWGNAQGCWDAIQGVDPAIAASVPAKNGLFRRIARMHQAIGATFKRKPHRQQQAEAQKLFHQANQWIRQDDWFKALPLLQKASAFDPDRYEIAYRLVQSVRQTGDAAATARIIHQVLAQSQWTENESQMLQQLKRPGHQS